MEQYVTVKRPETGVIGEEPDNRVSSVRYDDRVFHWRIRQLSLNDVRFIINVLHFFHGERFFTVIHSVI